MTLRVPDPTTQLHGLRIEVELVGEIPFVEKTPFQHVLIADTKPFGRALFLDQVLNSAEVDEGLYHSALVHPGMFLHPRPEHVLIGGGAEGATLREVLKHSDVQGALMTDIDQQAVAACKEHLPSWHQGVFDHPKASVIHEDVRKTLEDGPAQGLDVVVLDLGDPVSCDASQVGYTQEFYKLVRSRMKPNGMMITQAGTWSAIPGSNLHAIYNTVVSIFPHVIVYRVGIGSFLCNWAFIVASPHPLGITTKERLPIGFDQRWNGSGGADAFPWFDRDAFRAMTWVPPNELEALRIDRELINTADRSTLQTIYP